MRRRRGLAKKRTGRSPAPYRIVAHDGGSLMPGIDPGRLNQLVDELAVDAFVEQHTPAVAT